MPRGQHAGARNNPKPDALRRHRDGREWVHLDPAGYQGPIPDWPEEMHDPKPAEIAMWARLWRKPQATVWATDGVFDQVALYVRTFIIAQMPSASPPWVTAAIRLGDELMLSIPSLHAARYVIDGEIEGASPAFPEVPKAPPRTKVSDIRSRLPVVAAAPDEDDDS